VCKKIRLLQINKTSYKKLKYNSIIVNHKKSIAKKKPAGISVGFAVNIVW